MNKKIHKKIKKEDGFTLIELIIVLSIIGVIMSIAIPSFNKTLESSRNQADKATARSIGTAAHMAILDKVENISIENLKNKDYLENEPKPQQKGKTSFFLKIDGDTISVYYADDGDNGEPLYTNK